MNQSQPEILIRRGEKIELFRVRDTFASWIRAGLLVTLNGRLCVSGGNAGARLFLK
jgi:hypothetical protein